MTQPNHCARCGKWAGAHATLPGQPTDHLCMCVPTPVEKAAPSHVGDSPFEEWLSTYSAAGKGDKQRARDAYAAGMAAQRAAQPAIERVAPAVVLADQLRACSACP